MNLKIKALAAAAALATVGHASAALSDTFVQNGTLMLTVWNINSPQQSYVRDLGITLEDFLATPSSSGFTAGDALFASTFAGVADSNLRWNIIGVDAVTGDGVDNGARLLATFVSGVSIMTYANVSAITGNATLWAGTNNLNGCDLAVSCASVGAGPTYGGDPTWSGDINQSASPGSTAGTGFSAVNFYFMQGGETGTTDDVAEQLLGTIALGANGDVTFASTSVAPVPLPAAAWLFGAGLMSLAGVVRRRRVSAE